MNFLTVDKYTDKVSVFERKFNKILIFGGQMLFLFLNTYDQW